MRVKWNIRNLKSGNRDKIAFYGLISRHKVAEEGISEFDGRSTEIIQIETRREKEKRRVEKIRRNHPRSVEYQPEKTIIRILPPKKEVHSCSLQSLTIVKRWKQPNVHLQMNE